MALFTAGLIAWSSLSLGLSGLAQPAADGQMQQTIKQQAIEQQVIEQQVTKQQVDVLQLPVEVEGVLETGDRTLDDGSLYDLYPFLGEADQSVTVRMVSDDFDTYVLLIDPDGQVIAENNDAQPDETHSALTLPLPATGTYQVVANALDETGRGAYRLTITPADAAAAQQSGADQAYQQGIAAFRQEQYEPAIAAWTEALSLYEAAGMRYEQGATLDWLGAAHRRLGRYPEAIAFFEQTLAIAREIQFRSGEAGALSNLGSVYTDLNDYDQAIQRYEQALDIYQAVGDGSEAANTLGELSDIYSALGDYSRSIEFNQRQLTLAREIQNHRLEADALNGLAVTATALGNYPQAIELLQTQIALSREVGFRRGEAAALGNLGSVYYVLGDYDRAETTLQTFLGLTQAMGDRDNEVAAHGNLGSVYVEQSRFQDALSAYETGLALARELGDTWGEAASLGNIGTVYTIQGDHARALTYQQQSLEIIRELGEPTGIATSLGSLGTVYDALEDYGPAIDAYQEAATIARSIGNRRLEAFNLHNLSGTLVSLEQFTEAEAAAIAAIEIYESLRVDLSDSQYITLLDTQANTYGLLQEIHIAQNKPIDALLASERGRAQAFILQLSQRLNLPMDADSTVTQIPDLAEIQQIANEQEMTLVEYSLIGDRLLYIWVVPPTGDIQFRSVDLELDDLELDALDSGSVAGSANPLAALEDAAASGEASAVTTLVADLRSRGIGVVSSSGTSGETLLRSLYDLLIDPIADLLPADPEDKVVFIPQGSLFLVPFAALQDASGQHLIERHTVLSAPSIQTLGLASSASQARRLNLQNLADALVVGNPVMPEAWLPGEEGLAPVELAPLPGTAAEAQAIADFLNVAPLIGAEATEAAVKAQLPGTDIIHLATHGLLNYGDPQASGVLDVPGAIALTPGSGEDGLLTAAEILEMDLQAQLAILSACDTGRGRITGDGVVGLSRSLMTAGVPSVIVSLWAVPDAPTAELMTEFYRQLSQGKSNAQALRQAMLATLATYPEPRNWAAFTLVGATE
ncbi:MAG: CHAT domain-containing protein [Cyanobacteria bacterium P01_D01_bin.128]